MLFIFVFLFEIVIRVIFVLIGFFLDKYIVLLMGFIMYFRFMLGGLLFILVILMVIVVRAGVELLLLVSIVIL